ncbi:glycosyltransferase [uncultured Jatrophihabitans sp.]|uniref:glycosyltransferase n=1 Tax=uncultured Jatrophihabitans sp. TaxID=1610747 RepID=UPI0035CABE9E
MIEHVGVVIPAADEQELVGRCLESVLDARAQLLDHTRGRVSADVMVVLDACRDRTAEVVAGFADVSAVPVAYRCVGRVRAAGSAVAVAHAAVRGVPATHLWLANTDADSVVPRNWLERMVVLADAGTAVPGADVVVGTVLPGDELIDRARDEWLRHHDPRDGHRHVHGANLGVRASTLQELGGWSALVDGEDADLVARAERASLTVVRTGGIEVRTSARAYGRVPRGFAGYLRRIGAADAVTAGGPGTEVTGAAEDTDTAIDQAG